MTSVVAQFDDDCEIPSRPDSAWDTIRGIFFCAAIGIGFAYLLAAPMWVTTIFIIPAVIFVLKSVK